MSTKFYGNVGYGHSEETSQDVHQEKVIELPYRGDIKKDDLYIDNKQEINSDLRVSQLISIVMDPYAVEHYFNVRYVLWQGVRWNVTSVSVESPRLVLRLGDKYDGPIPNDVPNP